MQTCKQQPSRPAIPLVDARFVYTPAARTDVQATWHKASGWTPPSLQRSKENTHAA